METRIFKHLQSKKRRWNASELVAIFLCLGGNFVVQIKVETLVSKKMQIIRVSKKILPLDSQVVRRSLDFVSHGMYCKHDEGDSTKRTIDTIGAV